MNFSLTTFDKSGKLLQIEYALNRVQQGKMALGVKAGTLLKSFSKGKNLVNRSGQSIYGTSYVAKESSKKFFNGTAIAVTGRVGYGILSLQGSYQITSVLRDGMGANMNKFSVGIAISGL